MPCDTCTFAFEAHFNHVEGSGGDFGRVVIFEPGAGGVTYAYTHYGEYWGYAYLAGGHGFWYSGDRNSYGYYYYGWFDY